MRYLLCIFIVFLTSASMCAEPTLAPPKPEVIVQEKPKFEVAVIDPEDVQIVAYTTDGCPPCILLKKAMDKLCPLRKWNCSQINQASLPPEFKEMYSIRDSFPKVFIYYKGKFVARAEHTFTHEELDQYVAKQIIRHTRKKVEITGYQWILIWKSIQPLVAPLPQYKEDVDSYVESRKNDIAEQVKIELKKYLPSKED